MTQVTLKSIKSRVLKYLGNTGDQYQSSPIAFMAKMVEDIDESPHCDCWKPTSMPQILLEKENTIAGLENAIEELQRNADTPCTFGDCSVDDVPSAKYSEEDRERLSELEEVIAKVNRGLVALGAPSFSPVPGRIGKITLWRLDKALEAKQDQHDPSQTIENLKELNAQLSEQLEQQRDSDGRTSNVNNLKAELQGARDGLTSTQLRIGEAHGVLDAVGAPKLDFVVRVKWAVEKLARLDPDNWCGRRRHGKPCEPDCACERFWVSQRWLIDGQERVVTEVFEGSRPIDTDAVKAAFKIPSDIHSEDGAAIQCGGHDKDYKLCEVAGCTVAHAGESKDTSPEKQDGCEPECNCDECCPVHGV